MESVVNRIIPWWRITPRHTGQCCIQHYGVLFNKIHKHTHASLFHTYTLTPRFYTHTRSPAHSYPLTHTSLYTHIHTHTRIHLAFTNTNTHSLTHTHTLTGTDLAFTSSLGGELIFALYASSCHFIVIAAAILALVSLEWLLLPRVTSEYLVRNSGSSHLFFKLCTLRRKN